MTHRLKHVRCAAVSIFFTTFSVSVPFALAQEPAAPSSASPQADDGSDNRIFGVIPNYLTVQDPQQRIAPLTVKQKFGLFTKETFDPFTVVAAGGGAALSQIDNDNPKYGRGAGPFAERFGAAVADITTQNFFSDAVLASVFHQDPRYFRRGPEFGVWYRVGYALSRTFVTRSDEGNKQFNYSGIAGMGLGIALSNAYYPDASVSGEEVATRFGTSLAAAALGNLLPEFWPDIHERFFHRKPASKTPASKAHALNLSAPDVPPPNVHAANLPVLDGPAPDAGPSNGLSSGVRVLDPSNPAAQPIAHGD